jgi:hypothetical protein
VLFKVIRNADRRFRYGDVRLRLFRSFLDSPLDFSNFFQIMAGRRGPPREVLSEVRPPDSSRNRKTDRLLPSRLPLGIGTAVSNSRSENHLDCFPSEEASLATSGDRISVRAAESESLFNVDSSMVSSIGGSGYLAHFSAIS